MKQGQSPKRPRGHRGNGRRPSGGRNANFESSGPQGKIRGTAYQVIEKYQALGRDALTFGDRVAAENYFQHAEHYYRVMAANGGAEQRGGRQPGQPQNRPPQQQAQQPRPPTPQAAEAEAPGQAELLVDGSAVSSVEPEQKTATEESALDSSEAEGPTA
ncbi:MAG: DUF4167 domain-containing protein [Alphaproteobacteria bacterium]|jgi:hypothetical protein|nr:DUF4167 domain-containing protein [Alphaproteobacteria bacterium]MDP6589172.1 DUF4167 domain-containing protein [Alphaproteobacteria bacterium]MDP6818692.1 DUF4167 domain-containing protein [Alphaproteobacteria bacterium]